MNHRTLLIASLVVLAVSGPAAADEWRAVRVWIAGNDGAVWMLGESAAPEGQLPVLQMWFAGKKTPKNTQPKQISKLPPVVGKPLFVGADAAALRVLYSDLSAYDYFGDRPSSLGAVWREQCGDQPPVAWAGDSAASASWALAETATLRPQGTQPTRQATGAERPAQGTTSRESDEDDVPAAATPPHAGRLTLLQLRDGVWYRQSVPPPADAGQRFWLAARDGTLHLFWQTPGQGVEHAALSGAAWTDAEVVTTGRNLVAGWAGVASEGPLFVAGEDGDSDNVTLRLHLRREGAWSDLGVAREGNEALRINPATTAVGVVRSQLGVGRPTAQGNVEFGLGDLGTTPSIRFTTLTLDDTTPDERPIWEDALVLGVMMIVLTAVFWSRREKLAQRAILSPGTTFAAVHRRLLAALLDLMPAMMITFAVGAPWYLPLLSEQAASASYWSIYQPMDPELAAVMTPVIYGGLVLYGLWCMIWELATGSTPGKLVFKCRVLGINGQRALPRQIVIRNLARVVECSLGAPLLVLTLMCMAMLTRNRQRIGDLIADTLVVEPGEHPKDGEEKDPGDSPPGV